MAGVRERRERGGEAEEAEEEERPAFSPKQSLQKMFPKGGALRLSVKRIAAAAPLRR